jgi:hypothetical protein
MNDGTNPQHIMKHRSVWFLLVDAADGKPYKGIGAAKVSVVSSADVADFGNAVKASRSNKLSSVDAPNLLIYKNKESFDKRDTNEGKVEALQDDSPSGHLGKSKDEALAVDVPVATSPSLKPYRQERYKALSVEASCRKYLDAIASRLADF